MNVLVTGGTGYLGEAVVQALRRSGHAVVLYGRSARRTVVAQVSGTTPTPVRIIDGDVRDRESLCTAARGCDAIIHMAALVAVWRRRAADFDDVNVLGLRHVLDAARVTNVRRVVYTSSFLARIPATMATAPAWNDYQRTKAAADRLAAEAVDRGAPMIRLYPGVIYGPGRLTDGNLVGRQIADHLAGRLPGVVGADRIWSFSYVDDVAAAHVAALDRGAPERQYDLGGINAPQMHAFEHVRALTGRALPRRLPTWTAAAAAVVEEVRSVFGRPPLLTTGTLEILLRDWPLDHRLAAVDLGYASTPLDVGVRAIVDQVRAAVPSPLT